MTPAAYTDREWLELNRRAADRTPRLWMPLAALAVVGLLALIVTLFLNPLRALQTYWVNFLFWMGLAQAGVVLSALVYLTRGRWGGALVRLGMLEVAFLPIAVVLYLAGIVPGAYWLLPWVHEEAHGKAWWLNYWFFVLRNGFALLILTAASLAFAYWMLRLEAGALGEVGVTPYPQWLTRHWRGTRIERERTRRTLAWLVPVLILLYTFIYSLFGFDMVMSLDPHSLGWRGSTSTWNHYRKAYLLFAAIATPLVVSVHSVVSWDFAMSIVPGWHSTIFAPYFVAGAIHSGLAMVITLLIPLRGILHVKHIITIRHLEAMAKIIIVTGLIVGYAYIVEYFIAMYSANIWEQAIFNYRFVGDYYWATAIMVICNSVVPLALFFKRVRTSLVWLFVISVLVNLGMWFERFVIIVTSLAHDFLPYAWGLYKPTWVELSILAGSFGWFFMLFLLFAKHLPSISMTEVKEVLPHPGEGEGS